MARTRSPKEEWARVGAFVRLKELDLERAAILAAFPDLGSGRVLRSVVAGSAPSAKAGGRRRRRKLSAEARARMSEGMRKYWARRRAKAK